ncbi:MAG: SDR family oxidoreductase [Pseudomonadota bacterium]
MAIPQTPSFDLTGKRALVAGGTSGIGQAAAAALLQAGAFVTIVARNQARLEEVLTELILAGYNAEGLAGDITDIEATQDMVKEQDAFDILVNSAGLARHSPALETTPDDFDAVNAINVKGAYFLTQAVAQKLANEDKQGSLINISSQMAHVGGIDRAVYCGTKHAVEGFTKSMAIEWGPLGIRVNTICPTFIRTPLTEPTFAQADKREWIESKIKLGRVGEVEDIMGAVVYLASEASAMVTGTSLLIDGGWTAG